MTRIRFLSLLLVVGPTALAAQRPIDARWLPWLGCWQAEEPGPPLVCVQPASNPLGVEVATVIGGERVASRELIADGQPHDVAIDDCAGSQTVEFSTDGRRVYLRSTLTCQGGAHRTTSGIMAMVSPTTWLDAQSIRVDDEEVQQALRRSPALPAGWPDAFQLSTERADSVIDARTLAAAPVTLSDVEEAATKVDRNALATFVVERNQPFDVTAAGLVALDDAAVPDPVIDAVVAVSYPGRFAVEREETPPVHPSVAPPARVVEPYRHTYAWPPSSYASCPYGVCPPYSYGTPYSYYYNRSNRGYGVFLYPNSPYYSAGYLGRQVIVDRTVRRPQGIALNGRGYTRGGARGGAGSYARPRGGAAGGWTTSPGYSATGNSGGTGRATSGGYSRGGGSSSGSSSGTAKSRGGHK
jgi:hypothetical protein